MTKIIIIRKKVLLSFSIFFILIISLCIFFFNYNNLTSAFSINSKPNSSYYYDFDGDGIKDELLISEPNDYYEVKIKTSKKEFLLNCSNMDSLRICPSYNLKVNILDLSRDNIPEIILTNYYNNSCQYYIFKWNGDSFENIFCCTDNILGIFNSNNSRTPFVLKSNFSNKNNFSSYFINGNELSDITTSNLKIYSLDEIEKFIDLIEYSYEIMELPDIFTDNISSEELKIFWSLNKDTSQYKFQSAYFYDNDWNSLGEPSSIIWSLSFQQFDKYDSSKAPKEIIIHLTTTLDINQYKISSIKTT